MYYEFGTILSTMTRAWGYENTEGSFCPAHTVTEKIRPTGQCNSKECVRMRPTVELVIRMINEINVGENSQERLQGRVWLEG